MCNCSIVWQQSLEQLLLLLLSNRPQKKERGLTLISRTKSASQPASHLEYRYNDLVKAQMASVPFIAFIALVLLYREI